MQQRRACTASGAQPLCRSWCNFRPSFPYAGVLVVPPKERVACIFVVWFIDRRGAQCTTAVLSPQPDLRRRGPMPVASWRLQGTRADKPCVPSRASHSDLSEHPCPNRRHDALLYDRTMDLVSHFVFGFEPVVRAFAYLSDRARTNRSMGRLLCAARIALASAVAYII